VPPGSHPVWHLFVVRTQHRDDLARFLAERGIGTGRHYPTPVHLTAAYQRLGYRPGAFPVAEALARELLSLPLYPGITEEELDSVTSGVAAYFTGA
jgi:dTDP-4-amino-4,6-dideoxygalactose transaminase